MEENSLRIRCDYPFACISSSSFHSFLKALNWEVLSNILEKEEQIFCGSLPPLILLPLHASQTHSMMLRSGLSEFLVSAEGGSH